MTKILVVLLLAVCVFGQNPQTAVFPGASPMSPTVVTDSDLPVVNQSAQTKLNGGINASQTSGIVLVDGSRFKAPIIITIGTEKIFCTTLTTNTLSGCTRGYNVGNGATLAATHADQADVYAYIEPKHFNQAYKEIQSLETHAELIDRKDQNGGYVGRDSSGNASVPGSMTAAGFSMLYSGVGQYVEMKQGTAPPSPAANSFQLRAPTSIPTAYIWTVPSADAAGFIKSNGVGLLSVGALVDGDVPSNITRTIASNQTAMPTGALAANTCSASATTATATGALTTDAVAVTYASDPTGVTGYGAGTNGGITIRAWLTANTINFKLCNETGSSVTPGALSVNWRVTR